MAAVWLRWRSELRARASSWAALALLVGLAAGLVIAAAAGARRTDSAYNRFLRAQNAYDVIVPNFADPGVAIIDARRIERLPQVSESARVLFTFLGESSVIAGADERLGTEINRSKLLQGRRADPQRIDEVVASLTAAERLRLQVGSTFPLSDPRYGRGDDIHPSPPGVLAPLPPVSPEEAKLGIRNIRFRVVGIEVAPGEFPPQIGGSSGVLHMTPAFHDAFVGKGGQHDGIVVRLRHGDADLPAFRAALERLTKGRFLALGTQSAQAANVQRSFHLQAVALWLLALVLGLTAGLVFSQTLARQTFLDSTEYPILRALGMTRRQLWALGILRAATAGIVAAGLAVGVAIALSPLAPTGIARLAEPDPGVRVDVAVLGVGAAATVALVALLAALSAWGAAAVTGGALGTAEPAGRRPSRLVTALARAGGPPSLVAGVRMALEPGRGRSAVPVRTTLVGVVLGVASLVAAATFGASLTHLLDTPRLYGWNWDLYVTDYGAGKVAARGRRVLAADPRIAGSSVGGGISLFVNGRPLDAAAFDPVEGSVLPPVIAGRSPASPDEIALGTRSLRELGLAVGDTVTVRVPGADRRARMTVVGRVVLPAFSDTARFGEGGLLTFRGLRRLAPRFPATDAIIRLRASDDRASVLASLRRQLQRPPAPLVDTARQTPTDLVNFGRVQNMPLLLAAVVAALALTTLTHTLISSIRRRRRDLAVLKTLGFVRRQVLAAVAWQATTIASVALLAGVPLGVAAGRWAWALFADQLGIVREPAVPIGLVLLLVPGALVAANLVAVVPAQLAARTHPAAVLRVE